MISAETIRQILLQYEKYGWQLRRVLLTGELKESLSNSLKTLFGGTEIVTAEFNGAWFSRSSQGETTAWELRHLSDSPFALIDVVDNELTEDDLEDVLQSIELELTEKLESAGTRKGH